MTCNGVKDPKCGGEIISQPEEQYNVPDVPVRIQTKNLVNSDLFYRVDVLAMKLGMAGNQDMPSEVRVDGKLTAGELESVMAVYGSRNEQWVNGRLVSSTSYIPRGFGLFEWESFLDWYRERPDLINGDIHYFKGIDHNNDGQADIPMSAMADTGNIQHLTQWDSVFGTMNDGVVSLRDIVDNWEFNKKGPPQVITKDGITSVDKKNREGKFGAPELYLDQNLQYIWTLGRFPDDGESLDERAPLSFNQALGKAGLIENANGDGTYVYTDQKTKKSVPYFEAMLKLGEKRVEAMMHTRLANSNWLGFVIIGVDINLAHEWAVYDNFSRLNQSRPWLVPVDYDPQTPFCVRYFNRNSHQVETHFLNYSFTDSVPVGRYMPDIGDEASFTYLEVNDRANDYFKKNNLFLMPNGFLQLLSSDGKILKTPADFHGNAGHENQAVKIRVSKENADVLMIYFKERNGTEGVTEFSLDPVTKEEVFKDVDIKPGKSAFGTFLSLGEFGW